MTPLIRYPEFLAQFWSANAFLFLAQALPLRSALRLGELAGRFAAQWSPRNRRIAVDNILNVYPDLSTAEADALAVRIYEHFGRATVESVVAHRLIRPSTWQRHVAFSDQDKLHEVISARKGAVFVTAHVGVWEIFGLLLRLFDISVHSVYRPVKNPLIDHLIRRRRGELGFQMIPRKGALKQCLRVLRRGGYIALLADQHSKADGIWVPFLGRPASTTPGPALLALRTGAPIVMGRAERLPGTYQFKARFDAPMWVTPTGDRQADVRRITSAISRRMEDFVRESPDQWLWLHRRWRNPPPEVTAERSGDVGSTGTTD